MEWDDQWMLLNHPMLLNQSPENIWYFFTHFDRGQYFPLNQLYYIVIYQLSGFSPTAYHAGSLLLHGFNTGLVFLFMRNLVNYIGTKVNTMSVFGLIFLVPLLFAIHPLQVEAVAWISASKVLLYSTFTLTGLLCYIQYKRSGKIFTLLLVFLCYTLSLMSKEQAVIFPFNLLLIDLMLHIYHKKRFSGKVILEKVPFFVLALLFWYWSVQNNLGVLDMAGGYPLDQRLVLGSYSMIIYIFRFLLPVNLLYFYGFPIVAGESVAPFYYTYVLLGILLVMYIIDLYRRRRFVPFFGLLFFLVNIFLVLHILPMPREMITADRYMYLGIVGLSVWVVWAITRLSGIFSGRAWIRNGFLAGIVVLLIGFAVYSNLLTRKWENSETIKHELREYLQPGLDQKREE